MIAKLGDRLLGAFVPEIKAQAGGFGANAQTFCYCATGRCPSTQPA